MLPQITSQHMDLCSLTWRYYTEIYKGQGSSLARLYIVRSNEGNKLFQLFLEGLTMSIFPLLYFVKLEKWDGVKMGNGPAWAREWTGWGQGVAWGLLADFYMHKSRFVPVDVAFRLSLTEKGLTRGVRDQTFCVTSFHLISLAAPSIFSQKVTGSETVFGKKREQGPLKPSRRLPNVPKNHCIMCGNKIVYV